MARCPLSLGLKSPRCPLLPLPLPSSGRTQIKPSDATHTFEAIEDGSSADSALPPRNAAAGLSRRLVSGHYDRGWQDLIDLHLAVACTLVEPVQSP